MDKVYESQKYEDEIYKKWEESGFFNPDVCVEKGVCKKDAKTFSIVLPPPNVTGTLHVGHAAMLAIQDVMIRFHRMKGDRTLWLPGTDHAAIATQTKVEKLLMGKGMKDPKKELGRKNFLAEVEKFAQESHDTIIHQTKKMGSSLDWSREAFTLDEKRNLAVRTVFKKMYDDGLIYRGYRIVNWCPRCHSTLADDEVEYKEQKAKLYTFKYSSDFPFAISTTRPETKLGDTAVAVNPKDKRYKEYIGEILKVKKFAGGPDLKLKIICDESVDMHFGTGALGVTPAHSHVDYEMAQKNKLEIIKVIDEDGKMTKEAGDEYVGLCVLEARDKVVRYLLENNCIDKNLTMPSFQNNLSVCYRCGHAIEPLPSKQWFIDVNKKINNKNVSLKQLMQKAVKSKQIKIIPDRFNKTYFHWIDNLRDWCISRQIWYGHQIPVWYKKAPQTVNIIFLRHGESQANVDKVGAGHMDSPLTEKGRDNARELGKRAGLKLYNAIYSADLVRASETAKIVFGDLHKNIILDNRLREIDFGDITGKPGGDIDKYRLVGFPNGESYAQVRDRALSFLSDMIDKHAGQNIAVVAHSGTWKVLENIVHGVNFDFEHLKIHATREPVNYEITELTYVDTEAPQGIGWKQDLDTLDTWFSSGLWTFSTLGWPEKTDDLKNFHPTSVMETGYDILFFWVARMILMTTYVLGEVPFEKVYLHGLVRDEQGRKMSKSLGNVIDPLDVCEKYGTDAVRLSLLMGNTPGNDMCLSEEKIAGFRNFANKLWNIARFVNTVIASDEAKQSSGQTTRLPRRSSLAPRNDGGTLSDRWILNRLNEIIKTVTENIEKFNFSLAGEHLRDFTWNELADWYLEIAKIEGDKSEILNYILETILKLWHPFMPFVTEQIWSDFDGSAPDKVMLMICKWPSVIARKRDDPSASLGTGSAIQFGLIKDIITGIRSLRADYKIDPVKKLNTVISAGKMVKLLEENVEVIKGLARLEDIKIGKSITKPSGSVGFVAGGVEVFVDLTGTVDSKKETQRLQTEIVELKKYADSLDKKLSNEDFVSRAPATVVEGERKKMEEALMKLDKLEEQLKNVK